MSFEGAQCRSTIAACNAPHGAPAAQSACIVLSKAHCRVRFIDPHLPVALSLPVSDISFCTVPEAVASPARRINPRQDSTTSLRRLRGAAVALQVLFTPVGLCGVCNMSTWLSQAFASGASVSTVLLHAQDSATPNMQTMHVAVCFVGS